MGLEKPDFAGFDGLPQALKKNRKIPGFSV
jgi:hypothetical protein